MPDEEQDSGPDFSDILSQDDIDSLLSQATGGGDEEESKPERKSAIIGSDGKRIGDDVDVVVEQYDFRNPSFLGEMQMRRLRLMHEDFVRVLEARVSLYLRTEVNLNMSKLETVNYDSAINSIENPTHLALFKSSPLPGVGFIEINPRLALTVASSTLGGKGQPPKNDRYLTKIEIDLIEEFLFILLQEWCSQWQYESLLEPTITGHEVVGSVLQICESDTGMLSLTIECELRGCSGRIQVAVPLYMIEPLVRYLQVKRDEETMNGQQKAKPKWRAGYAAIPLKVEGVLHLGPMKVEQFLQLKVGDTIPMPENAMNEAVLRLAGMPVFQCQAGVDDDHMAMAILKKIKN